MNNKGKFIVFEGIDGSGKTTLSKMLEKHLISQNKEIYLTYEPTNSEIGSIVRKYIKGNTNNDERVIASLLVADRLNHILGENQNGIKNKIDNGISVICDRYYFSSYAYQGDDSKVPLNWLVDSNSLCKSILKPDIIFFINTNAEISYERIKNNRENFEIYENLQKLDKVDKLW